mgnify:CR=1 FL=1
MNRSLNISRVLKYGLVGLLNALIKFLIFSNLINHLNFNIFLAASIGFSFGALISYFLNSRYTFNSNKLSKEIFISFILLQILITFMFSFLIYFFSNFLLLNKNIAWLISATIVIILNFKSQKILFN